MIEKYPKWCNICGGKVIYTSNAKVYHGKEYGSGKCYLCTECGAYVGTHEPRPKEALGLLANERMRKAKMACHDIFDSKWKGKNQARKKRNEMYAWLADKLGIKVEDCHFGHFDMDMLIKAYYILVGVENEEIRYDKHGNMLLGERQ